MPNCSRRSSRPRASCIDAVTVELETLQLQLTTTAPSACCPLCTVPSTSVHSRVSAPPDGPPLGEPICAHPADRVQIRVPQCHMRPPHLHGALARAGRRVRSAHLSTGRGPADHRHDPGRERRRPALGPHAVANQSSPPGHRGGRVGLTTRPSLWHHPGRSHDTSGRGPAAGPLGL